MSTFIEFQNMILDKLCSIEDRLANIESVLGISDNTSFAETVPEQIAAEPEQKSSDNALADEMNDFQKQLNDIKSLFD